MEWQRWIPLGASLFVAAFVIALTATYVDALQGQGLDPARVPIWLGGVIVALGFGGGTYLITSLPERNRQNASRVAADLQEREFHLQQLLANAPVMMFRTNLEGVIELMEGSAVQPLPDGRTSYLGLNLLEFGEEGDDWVEFARRAIAGEQISALIRVDGKDWDIYYTPWEKDGKIAGMMGFATDVTVRRQAEEKQREAQIESEEVERLRQLNDMKTELLNNAAHELNTPMTPVRLQLHLLNSGSLGDLTERQVRAMTILDRSIRRLGSLIDDILDVARMQSGKLTIDMEPVALKPLLEEVVDTFQETAAQVGIKLRLLPVPDAVVVADGRRITQVLTNLASNAIKYTPEGGKVEIACQLAGSRVEVSFKDTGRGLDDAQIGKLFQPFSQVHDPKSVTARGSGLGLYICKGIMDTHDGEIGVTSPGPGKGSTFYFRMETTDQQPVEMVEQSTLKKPSHLVQIKHDSPMADRLRELI